MPVGDLIEHAKDKLVPGNSSADKITCCSKIATTLVFAIVFLVALFSSHAVQNDLLITSLVVNGTSSNAANPVPYPQVTFCPLWEAGVITGIECYEIEGVGAKGKPKRLALQSKKLNKNQFPDHPNWECDSFNFDGTAISSPSNTLWCKMNSTNHGRIDSNPMEYNWPGRVRVYIDTPGTTQFEHCEDCVDGIDGAILVADTSSFVFFQAHVIENSGIHNLQTGKFDRLTEYRAVHTSLPKPAEFKAVDPDDFNIALGFYSQDVWEYREPADLGAAVKSERFGAFLAFVGGLAVMAYLLHSCVSTSLILVLLGKESLKNSASGYEQAPIL